jgi:hypothetical protein
MGNILGKLDDDIYELANKVGDNFSKLEIIANPLYVRRLDRG